jgi:ubiquitin C-terminal hydrolase
MYRSQNNNYYQYNRSLYQQPNYHERNYDNDSNFNNSKICGITNLGNNCYLNSGLQILASCEELVKLIKNDRISGDNIVNELKNALDTLLSDSKTYYPEKFIKLFCSKNIDFIRGSQCCSQDFIRTLIRNINDTYLSYGKEKVFENNEYEPRFEEKTQYTKFIKANKIFPESKAMSIFSGISKSHSFGNCPKCYHKIDDYSFSYFIDQNIYLDEFYQECKFSDVLKANLGNYNTLTMDCPNCNKEIKIKEENKIVKLPKILIFTLERYKGPTNSVRIKPDEIIYMNQYIDKSLKTDEPIYELFAVNIRLGRNVNFGHEICQVKRGEKWYEINDSYGSIINNPSHFDCSYGLFYRKKENYYEINKKNEYESSLPFTQPYQNSSIKNNEDYKNQNINCAFEIIASFKELTTYLDNKLYLDKMKLADTSLKIKNIIKKNLKIEESDLTDLKKYFCNNTQDCIRSLITDMNDEFINLFKEQKNSSNLIEKNKDYNIIQNDSLEFKEYNEYLKSKKIFPQSEIYSIFYVMTKQNIHGKCKKCSKIYDKYLFKEQIGFIMDLPEKDCNFSKLLKQIENTGEVESTCDHCKIKGKFTNKTTIIKLPDILIFTLNRATKVDKNKISKVKIKPEEEIDMKKYIDINLKTKHTKYKLFAIVLMENNDNDLRYICKFNINEILAIIDNDKIENSYLDSSYGLFYRRSKHS